MSLRIEPTGLNGVLHVKPQVFGDERGFFLETYHAEKYRQAGLDATFVQHNHSRSKGGILRGLHAQSRQPQGKLVRCVEGKIWDVAVDARIGSPQFKQWVAYELTADNFEQLYVPPGFLHGFYVLSDSAQVEYKCTEVYLPEADFSVRWDDPELAIDWPLLNGEPPVLSQKDTEAPTLAESLERLQHYNR